MGPATEILIVVKNQSINIYKLLKLDSNKPETPDTGVVINLYLVSSIGQFGAVLWWLKECS